MAEAAVEDLRFYCHVCNKRFHSVSSSFTCPFCSNGFIEEVSDQSGLGDGDGSEGDDWSVHIRDMLMPPGVTLEDHRVARTRSLDVPRSGHRSRVVATSNIRPNIESFIQDVIINLGVGVNFANSGNMHLFLGNPGDYAWGREGLDTIITQLLNQMDSTGPPPLSRTSIDSLPVVKVDDEQVSQKLQCSVCWEDFVLNENVRQLPCSHIYHEGCIIPWLELHGTCPICRQNLGTDDQLRDIQGPSGTQGTSSYDDLNQSAYGNYNSESNNSSNSES